MREYGYLFLLIASNPKRGRRLLQGCQQALGSEDRAVVAHRYTTRPEPEFFEVGLTGNEFQARHDFGCFVLDWENKGVNVALGVEVDRWLDGGLNVLSLASASVIESARRRYRHHLRVVYGPGPASNQWLDRILTDKRVRFRQLGLELDPSSENLGPNIDGLRLEPELDVAVQQLRGWMSLPTPPASMAA